MQTKNAAMRPKPVVIFVTPTKATKPSQALLATERRFRDAEPSSPRAVALAAKVVLAQKRRLQTSPPLAAAAPQLAPERIQDFLRFVRRREKIRVRKERGARRPWSKDQILNTYKFTCVKREDDRTTRWLRRECTASYLDAAAGTVLLNCAVFRAFGTVAHAKRYGWNTVFEEETAVSAAADAWRSGVHAFSRAYRRYNFNAERGAAMTEPPITVYRTAMRSVRALAEALPAILPPRGEKIDWREMAARVQRVKGFGGSGFVAKELILDAIAWPSVADFLDDPGDYTLVGPGARRGVNRLLRRDVEWGVNAPTGSVAECRFVNDVVHLLEAARAEKPRWCKTVGLNIHDVQFCLCEFDKYERAKAGGRGMGSVLCYRPVRGALEEWHVPLPPRTSSSPPVFVDDSS